MQASALVRLRTLLRAQARSAAGEGRLGAGSGQALVSLALCGLTGDRLEPWGYAWLALSLSALLLLGPLLGEAAWPLRQLAHEDWLRSLPARPIELRLARHLAFARGVLTLALYALVPAALLAPGPLWPGGLGLLLLGLIQALLLAAAVGALQSLLAGRLEALLVALQALLLLAVFAALLALPPTLRWLGQLAGPAELPGAARIWPSGALVALCFESKAHAPELRGLALTAGAALLLLALSVALPAPAAPPLGGGSGPIARLFEPLARLLGRFWVRPEERPAYDLVRRALPREREVALRALPLLALPLVFAWVALGKPPGDERDGLLALLLFAPGFYLPVLQIHVAASQSHAARHLLELAPQGRAALERGAQKALVATYLLPTCLALGLLAAGLADAGTALSLGPLGFFAALLCLRVLYPRTVADLPLSLPIERIGGTESLAGPLIAAGVLLALLALASRFLLEGPLAVVGALLALLALERWTDRPSRGP
jgi:hypothetical protein